MENKSKSDELLLAMICSELFCTEQEFDEFKYEFNKIKKNVDIVDIIEKVNDILDSEDYDEEYFSEFGVWNDVLEDFVNKKKINDTDDSEDITTEELVIDILENHKNWSRMDIEHLLTKFTFFNEYGDINEIKNYIERLKENYEYSSNNIDVNDWYQIVYDSAQNNIYNKAINELNGDSIGDKYSEKSINEMVNEINNRREERTVFANYLDTSFDDDYLDDLEEFNVKSLIKDIASNLGLKEINKKSNKFKI